MRECLHHRHWRAKVIRLPSVSDSHVYVCTFPVSMHSGIDSFSDVPHSRHTSCKLHSSSWFSSCKVRRTRKKELGITSRRAFTNDASRKTIVSSASSIQLCHNLSILYMCKGIGKRHKRSHSKARHRRHGRNNKKEWRVSAVWWWERKTLSRDWFIHPFSPALVREEAHQSVLGHRWAVSKCGSYSFAITWIQSTT